MARTTQFVVALNLMMLAAASAAFAQTAPPPTPAPPAAPAAPEPAPAPAAPAPAPAPPAPAAPPAGYAPPPNGYPPPAYAPPPGYAYPPGYPPPGYPGYPPPGYAPRGYPPPPVVVAVGSETHDGFYLRLHLGFGYTSMSATSGGSKEEISGASGAFAVALGGAVAQNLILFGTITVTSISNPDIKIDGVSQGMSNITADNFGIGAGLAYYLEPANVYFAGSLLASQLQLNDSNNNDIGKTDFGFGFEALVGKEWWASDNWGLGVAGQFVVGSMKDNDALATGTDKPNWTVTAFSLLFSATYN